jgi:hypothetical protein
VIADLLTFEHWLHVFPSLFAILLCLLSRFDHLWIAAKVRAAMTAEAAADAMIINVQQIASGAASLNIHLINVFLFIAGALCAVFDWPRCVSAIPIFICILGIVLVVADVFISGIVIPLANFEREAPPGQRRGYRGWFRPPHSERLFWEQVLLNVIVLALIAIGLVLGGGDDANGRCAGKPAHTVPAQVSAPAPPKDH